jgi:ABC-2 type transport system permease protein
MTHRLGLRDDLRIVSAVAAKDIIDAVRNRTTLSIVLGVSIMMVTSLALPALLGMRSLPSAVAYDPNKPSALRSLTAGSSGVAVSLVSSEADMRSSVAGSPVLTLGLLIPPGFPVAGSVDAVTVDGYLPHWAQPAAAAALVATFQAQLSRLTSRPVRIETAGHVAYPSAELDGQPAILALNMALQILIVGLALVPYLWVEEKETRTLDALLVSPVRFGHVVAGKALTGLFYCLCGAAIVALFSARWIVHWDLALLATVLGAAFSVGLGLWMGTLCDQASTLNLWLSIVFMFLLGTVLLTAAGGLSLPGWLAALMPWTPAVALTRLLGLAMAGDVPAALWFRNSVILGSEALLLLTTVVWRMRRFER